MERAPGHQSDSLGLKAGSATHFSMGPGDMCSALLSFIFFCKMGTVQIPPQRNQPCLSLVPDPQEVLKKCLAMIKDD